MNAFSHTSIIILHSRYSTHAQIARTLVSGYTEIFATCALKVIAKQAKEKRTEFAAPGFFLLELVIICRRLIRRFHQLFSRAPAIERSRYAPPPPKQLFTRTILLSTLLGTLSFRTGNFSKPQAPECGESFQHFVLCIYDVYLYLYVQYKWSKKKRKKK